MLYALPAVPHGRVGSVVSLWRQPVVRLDPVEPVMSTHPLGVGLRGQIGLAASLRRLPVVPDVQVESVYSLYPPVVTWGTHHTGTVTRGP